MDATMRNLAANDWHVCYVSLYKATCQGDRCIEYADKEKKVPILSDADHLTEGGSILLTRELSHSGQLDCLKEKSTGNFMASEK
jgi:hypothetical protein